MQHQKVNVEKLTRRLKRAAGATPLAKIARSANVDASRVSRFLNGDFKKLTPVLRSLCSCLGVSVEEFVLKSPASSLSPAMLVPLRRIVGRDPKKILAVSRLLRNLEVLTLDGRCRAGATNTKVN